MDKIIIDSLRIFAYHGVNPEEQEDGQFFILDIEADIPLSKAGESDDIDDTVPPLSGVRVTCKKPDAPMKADFAFAAVSIYRERQ